MGQETLILDPQNPLIETYALSLSLCLYQEIGWFLNNPTQADRYKLLVDEFGNSYHVSWNLGMSDIAKPVGV